MFEYLRGTIAAKEPGNLVMDVGGVGYLLEVPASTLESVGEIGSESKILVHFHVREDTQKLFGFATVAERTTFRQLISVSQIGPKVALSVLSNISVRDLSLAVAAGDSERLKSIPGIGPKTAQRLVVELKGKLSFEMPENSPLHSTGKQNESSANIADRDAYAAMVSLGYSEVQVIRALARVKETIDFDAPVEEWIRRALQII